MSSRAAAAAIAKIDATAATALKWLAALFPVGHVVSWFWNRGSDQLGMGYFILLVVCAVGTLVARAVFRSEKQNERSGIERRRAGEAARLKAAADAAAGKLEASLAYRNGYACAPVQALNFWSDMGDVRIAIANGWSPPALDPRHGARQVIRDADYAKILRSKFRKIGQAETWERAWRSS